MEKTRLQLKAVEAVKMSLHSSSNVLGGGGVEVAQIGNVESGPGILWNRRILHEVIFLFCRTGEVSVSLKGGEEISLSEGEFIVLLPVKCLTLKTRAKTNRIEFLVIRGEKAVKAILSLGFWDLLKASDGGRDVMLDSIARHLEDSVERGCDHHVLAMTEFYLENLWRWIRSASGRTEFYDAIRSINCLSPEQMTTESAAAALNISRSKLNALFLSTMTIRPGVYLTSLKTSLAIALLVGTSLTVGKISERMGFSSTSAFACFFRKRLGCTPNSYRKSEDSKTSADLAQIRCV